jgi:hypothetical protein
MGAANIFTDSVIAQIKTRVAIGQHSGEIAEALGVKLGSLKAVCHRHRIQLRQPASRRGRGGREFDPFLPSVREIEAVTVRLEPAVKGRFQLEAGKRGISANELVTNIVVAVAEDNLITAILDDGQ